MEMEAPFDGLLPTSIPAPFIWESPFPPGSKQTELCRSIKFSLTGFGNRTLSLKKRHIHAIKYVLTFIVKASVDGNNKVTSPPQRGMKDFEG